MMSRVRALFFGTPAIAVPSLEALADIADVVGVVCQPDRPSGRGLTLTPPPVKERALALGLPVVQPEKIRTPDFAEWVRSCDAEVALVIAYGRILPKAILDAPRKGCLNLHASLLPKYRGAAPITWSIAHGEIETGISLMQMDEGMDTGPVFTRTTLPIPPDMTADELARQLAPLAAEVVRRDLYRVLQGEVSAEPQDAALATTAPILQKEDGRVDWTRDAAAVHDHVRAMTSWPGAFTHAGGKLFKVLATARGSEISPAAPGTVTAADKHGIEIACGRGTVRLLRGQLEGKKPLAAPELVSGRAISQGMLLGK
ncbi:MAG: methionyl-tRNA formyltransferase [Polyangiaceae bacterium]